MTNFKSLTRDIPLPIRLFLGKALLFFVIWNIIYGGFSYKSKIFDSQLTIHVAETSTRFLNSLGWMDGFSTERKIVSFVQNGETQESHEVSLIFHNDKQVLYIANACNGLELLVVYIGFIICMPSKFWRKTIYIILGVIALDFINILRCMGLIYLREYFHAYFDFAHHYLFKATVYTSTFLIWMLYSRKIQLKNDTIQIR